MPNRVVTKELAEQIWTRLDSGEDCLDIVENLEVSERTVQRLRTASWMFESDRPGGGIILATGWSRRMVSELGGYWDRFKGSRVLHGDNRVPSKESPGHLSEKVVRPEEDQEGRQRESVELTVDIGSRSHHRLPGVTHPPSSAWTLDLTLTNPSLQFPVGIKAFVLEVERGVEGHILHHLGRDTRWSNSLVPFSSDALDESLRIEPVTTVKGKLRFLDTNSFILGEGPVGLTLMAERSDGHRTWYELGEMNI